MALLHHRESVDLLPSNIELSAMEMALVTAMSREFTLKEVLSQVRSRYDYILIDCMPSLGMVTINALAAADSVIIPVQAQYLPAKGMTQLLRTIGKVKRQINPNLRVDGVLLTLVDNRTHLARQTAETLREKLRQRAPHLSEPDPPGGEGRRGQRGGEEHLCLRCQQQSGHGLRVFHQGGAAWRKTTASI